MHRRMFFQSLLGWGATSASAAQLPAAPAPVEVAYTSQAQQHCPRCGYLFDWPAEAYGTFGEKRMEILSTPAMRECPQTWGDVKCGWRGLVQFMRRSVDAAR